MGLHYDEKVGKKSTRARSIVFIMALMCVKRCTTNPEKPGGRMTRFGQIIPQGHIYREKNTSLEIWCELYTEPMHTHYSHKTSEDLMFFRDYVPVGNDSISRINKTTISLSIKNSIVPKVYYYSCEFKGDNPIRKDGMVIVSDTWVIFGDKPLKPKEFSCICDDWESLTCSWDPSYNVIDTKFDLKFSIDGPELPKNPCSEQIAQQCVINMIKQPEDMKILLSSHANESTDSVILHRDSIFHFVLEASNELGRNSFSYTVELPNYVKLAKPKNLNYTNVTPSSVLLTWEIPSFLDDFSPGFVYKIEYQSRWDGESWKNRTVRKEGERYSKMNYNLTGLEYANTSYEVRVYVRSGAANDERMWSDFSSVEFYTWPTAPGAVPRIDLGSFEIILTQTGRNVYIYWQGIPSYLKNGKGFTYNIVEKNGREFSATKIHDNCTIMEGITSNSYEFIITSMNNVGTHPHKTNIFVPSQVELPEEPKEVTKYDFGNGSYVVSWEQPVVHRDIVNYTIFWCENQRNRPRQCTDTLNWTHVPKNTTTYNKTVPNPNSTYQFAISANTAETSSGMVWTSCTVIKKKNNDQMKSVRVRRIGSTFIEIGWKLNCQNRIGIIQEFNVYYCEISPPNVECEELESKMTIKKDSHKMYGIVDKLKPYTTYKVTVTMLTINGESSRSVPLYKKTLRTSPTSPRDLQVSSITETSVNISWRSPETMDGKLNYYQVHYNNLTERVEEESLELRNLLPYHNYDITVAACTLVCGPSSPPVHATTNIDVPGKIGILQARPLNSDQVFVAWQIPSHPAGDLDYYEIVLNNGTIKRTNSTSATLLFPDFMAIGEDVVYQYRVRAVNIARNGIHLKGPWSDTNYCYPHKSSSFVSILIWIYVGGCILVASWCSADTIKTKLLCQSKLNQIVLLISQQQQAGETEEEERPVYPAINEGTAKNHETLVHRSGKRVSFADYPPLGLRVGWIERQSLDGLYSEVNIGE